MNHHRQSITIVRRNSLDLLRRNKQGLVDVVFYDPISDGRRVVVKLDAVDDAVSGVRIYERIEAHTVFSRVRAEHVVGAHDAVRLDSAPRERPVWLLAPNEENISRQKPIPTRHFLNLIECQSSLGIE